MRKRLAILILSLYILPVQANAQTNKAQQTQKSNKPPSQVAPITPQNPSSPALQAEAEKHVKADVWVVVTPEKDRFDKAAFWVNFVLALIGASAVVIGYRTLRWVRVQTMATQDAARAGLLAAQAANDQIQMMKDKERARIQVTPLDFQVVTLNESNEIMLEFMNIGPTPAFEVKVEAGARVVVTGMAVEEDEYTDLAIPVLLKPDKTESSWAVCTFPEKWEDAVLYSKAKVRIEVTGRVRYEDIFNTVWTEGFSFKMNAYGLEEMPNNKVILKIMRNWHPFSPDPSAEAF